MSLRLAGAALGDPYNPHTVSGVPRHLLDALDQRYCVGRARQRRAAALAALFGRARHLPPFARAVAGTFLEERPRIQAAIAKWACRTGADRQAIRCGLPDTRTLPPHRYALYRLCRQHSSADHRGLAHLESATRAGVNPLAG